MITATVNDRKEFKVEVNDGIPVVDGKPVDWDMIRTGNGRFHLLQDQQSYTIHVLEADYATKTFVLRINRNTYRVSLKDRFDELLHELGMDAGASGKVMDIKAPMPGLVVDVRVAEGQALKKGDAVVVLEAMKMENILKATADAVVKTVKAKKGSKVEKNEVLVILQ